MRPFSFLLLTLMACDTVTEPPADSVPPPSDGDSDTATDTDVGAEPGGMFAGTDSRDWRVVAIGNFPNDLTGSTCSLGDTTCYDCFHSPTGTYARWYRVDVEGEGFANDWWFEDVLGVLTFSEYDPATGQGVLTDGTGFHAIADVCVPMVWRYNDPV